MFEPLIKRRFPVNFLYYFVKKREKRLKMKAFSRNFIIVFRKKKNKLKFTGKRPFTKGSNIFLREFFGDFTTGHSPYFTWDIFNNLYRDSDRKVMFLSLKAY